MSLINDMLRDIEAKRPNDPVRQNLQREIRSLPAASAQDGKGRKYALLLGLVVVVGGGLLFAGSTMTPPASPVASPAVLATAPTPAVPPVAATPATAPLAPPLLDNRPAAAAAEPAKAPVKEDAPPSVPSVDPIKAAPILAVPDPVAPVTRAATARTDAPAAPAAPAALPSGPAKIEKTQVMATPRDRADAEYRKAENALAAGRTAEAVEGLRAALKQDPGYVLARQMLLRQLLDMRKTDEAIRVLQEGIELQPSQTGWAMSLARLQLEKNDTAAADRTLAASQSYAEGSADYAGFQGHLKTRLGAPRAAIAHYQRATRLAPQEGRWWLGLGLALEADGRNLDAAEAFRRSLATNTLSTELAAVAEQHLH